MRDTKEILNDHDLLIAVAKLEDAANWESLARSRNYLNSRDAVVPVIAKVITDDMIEMKFNYALYDILHEEQVQTSNHGFTFVVAVLATARQLSRALIKATEKS